VFVALVSVAPGKSVKPFGVASPLSSSSERLETLKGSVGPDGPPTWPTLPNWLDAAKDSTVTRLKFVLVDDDPSRAATISQGLAGQRGVVVADSLADFAASREDRCVALVADDPGLIRGTAERLKVAGLRVKIIAYATEASAHRIVQAMSAGAADFLHWPCDIANIVAAATAATASPAG
jgi:CheY-like chemotaxis protein